MTASPHQFSWKGRDTAAHNLLQLVYHAPPSIARRALELLQAIRSLAILADLVSIVDDEGRDIWQRIHALRAIASMPNNIYLPQLQNKMDDILQNRAATSAHAQLNTDLLDDICNFVAYHPANQMWFFAALNNATEQAVVRDFLVNALYFSQPETFRERLVEFLVNLLDSHPSYIDESVIQALMHIENAKVRVWLTKIIPAFEDKLAAYHANVAHRRQVTSFRRKTNASKYQRSPAYMYLFELYQRAENDNQQAFHQLSKVAKQWQGNIPLCAVATYMIGKLGHRYNVVNILCFLLKHASDDWGNDIAPLSPIRVEAGEALKDMPLPSVWMAMIDAFFINPTNVLSEFMIDWIAHLTDMLDGISTVYTGISAGTIDQRKWFKALVNVREDELP